MGKGLCTDGKNKVPWKRTGRAFNADLGLREGGSVKEGFPEEVISRQKPKGQGGIRKGNVVPGERRSTCKGPEAREGRFTMAGAQKKPRGHHFFKIITFKSFFGSRNGMNESTIILNQCHLNSVISGQSLHFCCPQSPICKMRITNTSLACFLRLRCMSYEARSVEVL